MNSAQSLAVIGLGTMGSNLARNAMRCGARVIVFNRSQEKTAEFVRSYGKEGDVIGIRTLEELTTILPQPRNILLMVQAGKPVDEVIHHLTSDFLTSRPATIAQSTSDQRLILSPGDAIIDAGNSHFSDTERRIAELQAKGIHFLGMGVSGGEEGALHGPSMMPAGSREAFDRLEPLLRKMAAKDGSGGKCVTYVGGGGAGHFVKMVHNGIEYGMMQLIAESYDILRFAGRTNAQTADLFTSWSNDEDLSSFLMEITAKILRQKEGDADLIDLIKDVAKQKGTGKWTTEAAMDVGASVPTINAAVDARILSGDFALRSKGAAVLPAMMANDPPPSDVEAWVRGALTLSLICVYQQGFRLMERADAANKWNLPFAEIARIWRGGCIIRSRYLEKLEQTYRTKKIHPTELEWLGSRRQMQWRNLVAYGATQGIPLPAFSSALSFYDAVRSKRLPLNIIQAQRDFFGAHGFERIDREGTFHADWE